MFPARRHAFTLVELLVVIAIIVSLLAILLPSMSQALGTAQLAGCASNMSQVYKAGATRATDVISRETFWRFDNGSGDYPWESGHAKQPGSPARALHEADGKKIGYLPTGEVFFCPASPISYEVYYNPSPTGDFQTFHGAYAWHWRIVRDAVDPYPTINNNSILDANPAARDLLMIDQRYSSTSFPFPQGIDHFNGLMLQGNVTMITRNAADIPGYLWGSAGKPY